MYLSNFETIGKADLTRSGDNANVFGPGIPTVMSAASITKRDFANAAWNCWTRGWKFTGVTTVYDTEDFDWVSELMEKKADGFIKGAFRP